MSIIPKLLFRCSSIVKRYGYFAAFIQNHSHKKRFAVFLWQKIYIWTGVSTNIKRTMLALEAS
jgi:Ni,Fe-hydrogenase I cytochrome b subunit